MEVTYRETPAAPSNALRVCCFFLSAIARLGAHRSLASSFVANTYCTGPGQRYTFRPIRRASSIEHAPDWLIATNRPVASVEDDGFLANSIPKRIKRMAFLIKK